MNKIFLLIVICVSIKIGYAQKILYGFDVSKSYGARTSPTKMVSLTNKSVFCEVQINFGGDEMLFTQFCGKYDPFIDNTKRYTKGISDIKKLFGNPINVYTDKEFTKKTESVCFWKVLLNKKYYIIHYFLVGELHLHINKYSNQEEANRKISDILLSETLYNKKYFVNFSENNL